MFNATTDVYATKREVIHFAKSLVSKKKRVTSKL